jgi:hypothetical protein
MALGLIQPLTEMSTRNISWGYKGGRYVRLTSRPVMGLLYLYLNNIIIKISSSATSYIKNPTWTSLNSNPGIRVDKPTANSQRYGTSFPALVRAFMVLLSYSKQAATRYLPYCAQKHLLYSQCLLIQS